MRSFTLASGSRNSVFTQNVAVSPATSLFSRLTGVRPIEETISLKNTEDMTFKVIAFALK